MCAPCAVCYPRSPSRSQPDYDSEADIVIVDLDPPTSSAGSPPASAQYSAALARSAVADASPSTRPGLRVATPTNHDVAVVPMTVNPIGGGRTRIRIGAVSAGPGPVAISPLHWPGNQSRLHDAAAATSERARGHVDSRDGFLSPKVLRELQSLGFEEDVEYGGPGSPSRRTPPGQPSTSIADGYSPGHTFVSVTPTVDHPAAATLNGARSPSRHGVSNTTMQGQS